MRGFCAPRAAMMTTNCIRGANWYPDTLQVAPGDDPLTYADWMSNRALGTTLFTAGGGPQWDAFELQTALGCLANLVGG